MELQTENKSVSEIVQLVFKAVGLAMGVASLVLVILGEADFDTLATLYSIGLTAIGISVLNME